MSNPRIIPSWQNAIIILSGAVVSLILVVGLQWGRPVLVPIALAILLTFLLNPLVSKLQQLGLRRIAAVMAGVLSTGVAMLLIGGLVARQVAVLVAELPQNTANIKTKVRTLRQFGSGPMATQLEKMADEIIEAGELPATQQSSENIQGNDQQRPGLLENAVAAGPVLVRTESTLWLSLTGYLSSAFEALATLAFSLILLVVLLISRDDLRDRVVALAGRTRVAVTSRALEDVTERISRYLLMVALLNGGFGILLSLGLFALQVPYAFLWGFLAGSLRFIPYIGPWIGAIGPIGISLATSNGWMQPFAVFGLVVVLELVGNNVLEPLIFGRSTGVSSTALIISAALWFYLWGPIGLILSAPIAVCLMVVGKNIHQLAFLNLLLGSEPALNSDMSIYQRFMLGDEQEATRLILPRLEDTPAELVFDDMLIPTLNFAKQDFLRNQLSEEDYKLVVDGVQTSLGHTEKLLQTQAHRKTNQPEPAIAEVGAPVPVETNRVQVLLCPAQGDSDAAALTMLTQSLDSDRWDIKQASVETLTSELVARIAKDLPAILCIAALPPRGLAHARYLCKRLRESSPRLQIVVGRWGQKRNCKLEREQLEQAGATFVTTSLAETTQLLSSRLPLLSANDSIPTVTAAVTLIPCVTPARD